MAPGDRTLTWRYTKDGEGAAGSDAGFVDNIEILVGNNPDFVLTGLTFDEGLFTVGLDSISITATGKNIGTPLAADTVPAGFKIEAQLSPDGEFESVITDNIDLGDLDQFEDLGEDNVFTYQRTFFIDASFPPGDYFVVLRIDNGGAITEITVDNNGIVSETAAVSIQALPDLQIVDISFEGGLFFQSNSDELLISIDVANGGEADIVDVSATTSVVLSINDIIGDGDDIALVSFVDPMGLSAGSQRTLNVTAGIPGNVALGTPYFVGVTLDTEDVVVERDETNNSSASASNDIVFSELDIPEAFDTPTATYTFPHGTSPWFGQSAVSFDGEDAVQSSAITDSQSAAFQTEVTIDSDTVISFYWKVSSEENGDFLQFFLNDVLQDQISGDADFALVSFPVVADEYVLKWVYAKNDTASAGEDTAFVDVLRFEVPDVTVRAGTLVVDPPVPGPAYVPGEEIGTAFTIENNGNGTAPADSFTFQIWLSTDIAVDASDILLLEQSVASAINDVNTGGNTEDIAVSPTVPDSIGVAETYFMIIVLDASDALPEANEGNNTFVSAARDIALEPTLPLDDAVDGLDLASGEADAIDFGAAGLDPATSLTFTTGGDSTWFGQVSIENDADADAGQEDAAKTPLLDEGETSFFETVIPGPVKLTFDWLIDSDNGNNFLAVSVDGKEKTRISGDLIDA